MPPADTAPATSASASSTCRCSVTGVAPNPSGCVRPFRGTPPTASAYGRQGPYWSDDASSGSVRRNSSTHRRHGVGTPSRRARRARTGTEGPDASEFTVGVWNDRILSRGHRAVLQEFDSPQRRTGTWFGAAGSTLRRHSDGDTPATVRKVFARCAWSVNPARATSAQPRDGCDAYSMACAKRRRRSHWRGSRPVDHGTGRSSADGSCRWPPPCIAHVRGDAASTARGHHRVQGGPRPSDRMTSHCSTRAMRCSAPTQAQAAQHRADHALAQQQFESGVRPARALRERRAAPRSPQASARCRRPSPATWTPRARGRPRAPCPPPRGPADARGCPPRRRRPDGWSAGYSTRWVDLSGSHALDANAPRSCGAASCDHSRATNGFSACVAVERSKSSADATPCSRRILAAVARASGALAGANKRARSPKASALCRGVGRA